MAWIVLVLSGICEAVWAVALDKSQGFTKIIPVIVSGRKHGWTVVCDALDQRRHRLFDLGGHRCRNHR